MTFLTGTKRLLVTVMKYDMDLEAVVSKSLETLFRWYILLMTFLGSRTIVVTRGLNGLRLLTKHGPVKKNYSLI